MLSPTDAHRPPPSDYAELKRLIVAAGLLQPQPLYYALKTTVAVATFAAVIAIAITAHQPWIVLLDGLFFGFAVTQIALIAHDVGHRQWCRSNTVNTVGLLLLGNLLLGVSYSWWVAKHNAHHAAPNVLEGDPDIDFPMLVFSPDQIAAKPRVMRPFIAVQAYIFVFVLPFQALGMRIGTVSHLLSGRARWPLLQFGLIGTHFALLGLVLYTMHDWPLAIGFAVIGQASWGLYNSSLFASNHKGMPVLSAGERLDFLREQVLTSRNVDGHRFTDFWCGGLNYQIEHHLFPTMARNRLAEAQVLVRSFCDEHSIPYYSTSLATSYREVVVHLHRASAPLRQSRVKRATSH